MFLNSLRQQYICPEVYVTVPDRNWALFCSIYQLHYYNQSAIAQNSCWGRSLYTVCTVFLQSDAVATIYFAAHFVRLLFEGGIYFFGKPGDIKDSWIRYIQMRRWRLLDTVSSARNFSVLLLAVGTTQTVLVLALAWWPSSEIICTRAHVLRLLAAAKIWGRCIFRLSFGLWATIRGRRLFKERCTNTLHIYTVWTLPLTAGNAIQQNNAQFLPGLPQEVCSIISSTYV